jgi:regulator of replication initiation timing
MMTKIITLGDNSQPLKLSNRYLHGCRVKVISVFQVQLGRQLQGLDNMKSKIQVIKASGEKVLFAVEKLRNSLARSGAGEDVIEEVVKEVESQLHDEMSTKRIYQMAFKILNRKHKPAASKYKLKKAIMELGPSGFPFEKYISELLLSQGHSVKLNVIMKGRCVNHEVDILAAKDGIEKVIECKYHNLQGTFCDVKVSLYVHSRFNDIILNLPVNELFKGWVITNTRFSSDAIQYARCSELNLLGWDYPVNAGLRESIDQIGLYPVTCLTSMTQKEKSRILAAGVVLCRQIGSAKKLLAEIGIPAERISGILHEASVLSAQN